MLVSCTPDMAAGETLGPSKRTVPYHFIASNSFHFLLLLSINFYEPLDTCAHKLLPQMIPRNLTERGSGGFQVWRRSLCRRYAEEGQRTTRKSRWSELLSFLFELSYASDNVREITFQAYDSSQMISAKGP